MGKVEGFHPVLALRHEEEEEEEEGRRNRAEEYAALGAIVECFIVARSYSVMLMIVEFRNSAQHDWVLKFLWVMCAIIASLQLWTEIEEESKVQHPRAHASTRACARLCTRVCKHACKCMCARAHAHARQEHHKDFAAFVVHYVLYLLMALAGFSFREVRRGAVLCMPCTPHDNLILGVVKKKGDGVPVTRAAPGHG